MAADRFRTKSKARYREAGLGERQVSLYSTTCFETHSWTLCVRKGAPGAREYD